MLNLHNHPSCQFNLNLRLHREHFEFARFKSTHTDRVLFKAAAQVHKPAVHQKKNPFI